MKRIVIVEDDEGIRDALKFVFDLCLFEVVMYENIPPIGTGETCLPHLFIIDAQLAGANGIDLCYLLKQNGRSGVVPVIIMSANPYTKQQALDAGADAFLEKPFKLQYIRQLVATLTNAGR